MFTGLVEAVGIVRSQTPRPPGMRLTLAAPADFVALAQLGESVAVNGCCLTVTAFDVETLSFDVGDETLKRTNLGQRHAGAKVNLERAMRLGDRIGGHLVSGHVDGVGRLLQRIDKQDWADFRFAVPEALSRQLVSKGSIAVDGVSLTLVDVDANSFSVMLIPHTLAMTTLGGLSEGDAVNLETDLLAKYVERQLGFLPGVSQPAAG
ncbi:MAG TPA: riboflavin synthase [Pirellulaceae bacterium]|jgi:riboflavin synthase|nr:riboflavin synthase [Pirellulaceae bacterium]